MILQLFTTKETPLPPGIAWCFLCNLACGMASTFVFPFNPFYAKFLSHADLSQEQISYRTSLLGTGFLFARMFSEVTTGAVADRIGVGYTISTSFICSAMMSLLFATAGSLTSAVFYRVLWGTVNGVTGASILAVTQLTDGSNRKIALAMSTGCWCMGGIFGAAIGGLYGIGTWSKDHTTLFQPLINYPALLPCLCVCGPAVLAAVGIRRVKFPEKPNVTKSSKPHTEGDTEDSTKQHQGFRQGFAHWKATLLVALKLPGIWHMVIVFAVARFGLIALHELFPLLTSVDIEKNPNSYGLGFLPSQIGTSNVAMGIVDVFVSFVILPYQMKNYNLLWVWIVSLTAIGVSILGIPLLHFLLPNYYALWIGIVSVQAIRAYGTTIGFASGSTMVAYHSGIQDCMGTFSGFTQATGNFIQMIGAGTTGTILGITQKAAMRFPFDEYFIFLLCGAIVVGGAVSLLWLDTSMLMDGVLHKSAPSGDADNSNLLQEEEA